MSHELFVLFLGGVFLGIAVWCFRRLPAEGWQILASVPVAKDPTGHWHGLNLTYYGLLTANALVIGIALTIVLMAAVGVPVGETMALILVLLAVCLPAAKWVARAVEGKNHTFTVAGAFFVGLFLAPLVVGLLNLAADRGYGVRIPMMPALAALTLVYAFGEGLGRLACISFGCCYGRRLAEVHPTLRRIFRRWNFVFFGEMKKISYASGMEGQEVVPIQALTSIICLSIGLAATYTFLEGYYSTAFLSAMIVTQGWRTLSETLRADYRGEGKFTLYQLMGIFALLFTVGLAWLSVQGDTPVPELRKGIETLWHPAVVLTLQLLWFAGFFFFGKSMVTGAEISFHVYHDRI